MVRTLHFIELAIPMRDAFVNASSTLTSRQTLLVGVEEDGLIGWGEAAPYPGINPETVDRLWTLLSAQPRFATGPLTETLPATAAAAIDEAHADLAARRAGIPLWQHHGGVDAIPLATVAIGLSPTPTATVASVYRAHEAGFLSVKLKIAPGHDHAHIAAVRDAYPEVAVCVDANGSYQLNDPFFDTIDELGLTYIEQPFGATRIGDHELLRTRVETLINLDESAHSDRAVRRAIAEQSADIITLKPGLLGPTVVAELITLASAAEMGVKISGLIETSVGRSHTRALASMPGVAHVDLAPPRWFLTDDVAPDVTEDGWQVIDGTIGHNHRPGIGVEIDELALGGIVERSATLPVR